MLGITPERKSSNKTSQKKPFNVSVLLTAHANQAEGFQLEKKTLEAVAVTTLPVSGHPEKVSLCWAVLPQQQMLSLLCVGHIPGSVTRVTARGNFVATVLISYMKILRLEKGRD